MEIKFVSNDILSLEDATRELDINRATLYRWIASDKLAVIKLGKTPVILRSEIERLQKIGAKRKYEHHKAPRQLPKVLQPPPLPKVKQPVLP